MARSVAIAARVLELILQHAREIAPAECCGVLIGRNGSVTDAVAVANVAADPLRHYLLDPKGHIDARREARTRGDEILGFYHSHPHSPPVPSDKDRAEAGYPGCLYLIAGANGDVRLYELSEGALDEVPFVPVP